MIHYKQRIARMAEELISDFLKYDCRDMNLRILEERERYVITISGSCQDMRREKANRIKKLLNQPRNPQMEEYYWSLSGDSDVESEFALLGIMSDHAELDYDEKSMFLSIKLTRSK